MSQLQVFATNYLALAVWYYWNYQLLIEPDVVKIHGRMFWATQINLQRFEVFETQGTI